jgi:hypothetical protein
MANGDSSQPTQPQDDASATNKRSYTGPLPDIGGKPRQKIAGSRLSGSYKRGGKVSKTGLAKVHKGERVLTAKQARKFRKEKQRR